MSTRLGLVACLVAASASGCIDDGLWDRWDAVGQDCADSDDCSAGLCIFASDNSKGICTVDCNEGRCARGLECLEVRYGDSKRSLCFQPCHSDPCGSNATCQHIDGHGELCLLK